LDTCFWLIMDLIISNCSAIYYQNLLLYMISEEIIKNIPPLVIKYLRNELKESEWDSLYEWISASSENFKIFEELIDVDKICQGLEEINSLKEKEAACLKRLKGTLVFSDQPNAD
jgi:hypothetical protein